VIFAFGGNFCGLVLYVVQRTSRAAHRGDSRRWFVGAGLQLLILIAGTAICSALRAA